MNTRTIIFVAGALVAVAAAVATVHGLYEVAVASKVPAQLAWTYPLMTDGLALVAYAGTHWLRGTARHYAWLIVVLAAALSGVAQAVYLAAAVGSVVPAGNALKVDIPGQLAAGVGAWPAIAAAITAHLLHLLAQVRDEGEAAHHDAKQEVAEQPALAAPAIPAPPLVPLIRDAGPNPTKAPRARQAAAPTKSTAERNAEIEADLRGLIDAGKPLPSLSSLRRDNPGMGPDRARGLLQRAEGYATTRPIPIRKAQ